MQIISGNSFLMTLSDRLNSFTLIENIMLNILLKPSSLQKSVYKFCVTKISVKTIKMAFNGFLLVDSPRAGGGWCSTHLCSVNRQLNPSTGLESQDWLIRLCDGF